MENKEQDSLIQMHLDYDGGNILRDAVKWSRFLSILGIIGLSFYLLVFVLAGSAIAAAFSKFSPGFEGLAALGGAIVIIFVMVFFAVMGFLVYLLSRFSKLTRKGIDHQDQATFSEGMKCLKNYFLVTGILAILFLLFNCLSLIQLF